MVPSLGSLALQRDDVTGSPAGKLLLCCRRGAGFEAGSKAAHVDGADRDAPIGANRYVGFDIAIIFVLSTAVSIAARTQGSGHVFDPRLRGGRTLWIGALRRCWS